MSQPRKDLQKALSDVLQCVMSMSASVIKKSEILLKDVEALDSSSADTVTANTRKLLDRISTNLSFFVTTFDTAVNTFKLEVEKHKNGVSPRTKLSLSLRRRGDTEDTDADLTNLRTEETPTSSQENSEFDSSCEKDRKISGRDDKETGSDHSETDTEKTIPYFDVFMEDISPCENIRDDLNKALDDLDKNTKKTRTLIQKMTKSSTGALSFDFDDFEDSFPSAEVVKLKNSIDEREQIRKDNHELLELLNKLVGGPEETQLATEEDGDEALRLLEEEFSLSSGDELGAETDASSMSQFEANDEGESPPTNEDDEDGNVSDVSSHEPGIRPMPFTLSLKKIDECDDAEIDRLCDLHSLDKRKCLKRIRKFRVKKGQRKRILASSSSPSSSSDDSTVSDLANDARITPPTPLSDFNEDITALADELLDRLDKEDDMDANSDSGTDTDLEDGEENTTKKKKLKDEKNDNRKHVTKTEETKRVEKRRGSWRDKIRLWSDSGSESNNDVQEIVDDVDNRSSDDVEEIKNDKQDLRKSKVFSDVTTIITDSDSDDSGDVTFVGESTISDNNLRKGRRNIRAILSDNELDELTQRAKTEENERILRLEEHSKTVESVQSHREEFILDVDVNTNEALIIVDYNLASMLKPHQREGIQFMWEACYGSVALLKDKPGTGCILAHCMGLGKTLQVITLIHTLFTHPVTETKHVLVICPLSTVHNWQNEFKKTFRHLADQCPIRLHFLKGDISGKIFQIRTWSISGGVLVMGYESFQILTNEKISARVSEQDKQALDAALLHPGPDLIVCDEGHLIKNGRTLRSQALMKVKTRRRVVLTGTPLQNNLKEYYYMVHFVKPHLLGTITEYNNRFSIPIANGQFHDSTPEDIKLMKKRTHVLNKLLKKTIHRVEANVLQSYLPEILDYTLFLRLTPLQVQLYTKYIEMVYNETTTSGAVFFYDFMILSFNSLHPYTLRLYYTKSQTKKRKRNEEELTSLDDREHFAQDHVRNDWYKDLLPDDVSTNVDYSSKLKFILDAIDETVRCGEKALVFGKWLVELDVLEHFLKVHGTSNMRAWRPNVDYYRMDGNTPIESRSALCKRFNSNSSAKIFMLTHKIGGLGLNLTGANRVLMIGSNHNPSLDTQSMYRVYRFGQTKKCYVYRLLSLGTMEEQIYRRCVIKLHLSGTVVDKLHFGRPFTANDFKEMYKIRFNEFQSERPIQVVPTDKLLAALIQKTVDVYRYHLHNSLLENRPEEELTDEDKKLAWDEFNQEESRSNAPNMVPNPASNSSRAFLPGALQPEDIRPQIPTSNYPFLTLLDQPMPQVSLQIFRNNLTHAQRLQGLASSYQVGSGVHGANEASPPSGEFNYALNKVV